jgi:hypothetical protein
VAWRFRKVPIVSTEIIHPDSWVQNHMEYVMEFNGMLDRDNLPSNLDYAMGTARKEPWTTQNIQKGCFHKILSDKRSNYFFFKNGFAGWAARQDDIDAEADIADRKIGEVSFTATTEGMVIAHWTGWLVSWPYYGPVDGPGYSSGRSATDEFKDDRFHKRSQIAANFRILVNGTEVSNSGKHSGAWHNQCVSMTGASPVEAGEVNVVVQGRAGVFRDLEFEMRANSGEGTIFLLRNRELIVIFKKR